jgi:hypothetical protein
MGQSVEKALVIAIVVEDLLPPISPAHYMVDGARKFNLQRSAHFGLAGHGASSQVSWVADHSPASRARTFGTSSVGIAMSVMSAASRAASMSANSCG